MAKKDNSKNSKKDEKAAQPSAPEMDLMTSVTMAFNMGVSANQSSGHLRSVAEIAPEIGRQIYDNLSKAYGGQYKEEFLMANTEFFLQIALLGFIIPSVCTFEEDFKNKLFALIEAKSKQNKPDGKAKGDKSNIIIT